MLRRAFFQFFITLTTIILLLSTYAHSQNKIIDYLESLEEEEGISYSVKTNELLNVFIPVEEDAFRIVVCISPSRVKEDNDTVKCVSFGLPLYELGGENYRPQTSLLTKMNEINVLLSVGKVYLDRGLLAYVSEVWYNDFSKNNLLEQLTTIIINGYALKGEFQSFAGER